MPFWITCQLGAREHYAIPRALDQSNQLYRFITDSWVTPQSVLRYLPTEQVRGLRDRYHPELAHASIESFTHRFILLELGQRLSRTTGWSSILARNQWFQTYALQSLKKMERDFPDGERPILFSYSYTALKLFKHAKERGWYTVLGQIDPGIKEEKLVSQLQAKHSKEYESSWNSAPFSYWKDWKEECHLADRILVNSTWSQNALIETGVPLEKIVVVPLAYKPPPATKNFVRTYPSAFTRERPMRVLFLGQVILRKGIAELLCALNDVIQEPLEVWLVGSTGLSLSIQLRNHPKIKWIGSVPRSHVQDYYREADIFLFPTHSDGFGLTQLEAQAWRLPVIASSSCGKVVSNQKNGLILSNISAETIAESLRMCCRQPEYLQQWSDQTINLNLYSINQLSKTLQLVANASL